MSTSSSDTRDTSTSQETLGFDFKGFGLGQLRRRCGAFDRLFRRDYFYAHIGLSWKSHVGSVEGSIVVRYGLSWHRGLYWSQSSFVLQWLVLVHVELSSARRRVPAKAREF